MTRPTNKEELIELGKKNYNDMFELINSFEKSEIEKGKIPFEDRDKNMRDILAHLHHWHTMMLDWYKVGMGGEKPQMPAKGYTWKTTYELNLVIWEMYQNKSYNFVVKLLNKSFSDIQKIIKSHSSEELFTKKKYYWTGTTSLGAYFVSATSSHYDWAIKKIKKYKKAIK
jgi:hypothetical protein